MSVQNHREQSWKTVMSNVSAMYRMEPEAPVPGFRRDDDTERGLDRYIKTCRETDRRLQSKINALADGKRSILVWGVGTHTSRLLAVSRLAEVNIAAFIESNARYHGKMLHGRPILAPDALPGHAEPVLISSRVFQHEIAEQIRALGCTNELILLYDT